MFRMMITVALLALLAPAAQASPSFLTWRPVQPVGPAGVSQHAPSAVSCGGGTYLAWRRVDGRVLVAAWMAGSNRWTSGAPVGGPTEESPVAACDNGQLTVLWRDTAVPANVVLRRSPNGSSWSLPEAVPGVRGQVLLGAAGGVSGGAGLAPFFVVWRGEGTDTQLYYTFRFGGAWQPVRVVPLATSTHAPEVDLLGPGLTVTYRALDGQIRLVTNIPGSLAWSTPATTGAVRLTSVNPSAARVTGSSGLLDPFLLWKDNISNRMLYAARSGGWSGSIPFPVGAGTSHAPTSAAAGVGVSAPRTGVVAVWKDAASSALLYSTAG